MKERTSKAGLMQSGKEQGTGGARDVDENPVRHMACLPKLPNRYGIQPLEIGLPRCSLIQSLLF